MGLLALDGVLGLRGWQWLFLAEGLPAVVLGLGMRRGLPEGPGDERCTWLSEEEKRRLRRRLDAAAEERGVISDDDDNVVVSSSKFSPSTTTSSGPFFAGARVAGHSWRVWYFAVQWFFAYNAYYGILFFGPLLIGDTLHPGSSEKAEAKRAGDPGVLWLATVPYVFAGFAVQINAAWCERRGNRPWRSHVAIPLASAAAALFAMPRLVADGHRWLAFVALVAANCGVWSAYGPLGGQWQSLHGGEAGAAALAIINSTANLGGLMGPVVLGHFDNTMEGLSVLAALLLVSAGMVAMYPLRDSSSKRPTRTGNSSSSGGRGGGGKGRDFVRLVEDQLEDDEDEEKRLPPYS